MGIILIKLAPEERKLGKSYFALLQKTLFFAIVVNILFFYKVNIILTTILLVFVIILILNKKLDFEKPHRIYFFLGIIFYLSNKVFNLFVIESVLIFMFGIPTSSLILKLKKKNYYEIFIKNLWFFAPTISLYFIP